MLRIFPNVVRVLFTILLGFYSPCKTEVSNKQDGTIGIVGHFNSQENHRRALKQANFTEHLRHVLKEYYNISCEEKDKHWNSYRSKKIQKNLIQYNFRFTIKRLQSFEIHIFFLKQCQYLYRQ